MSEYTQAEIDAMIAEGLTEAEIQERIFSRRMAQPAELSPFKKAAAVGLGVALWALFGNASERGR
jgi:hypothetical protein